VPLLPPLPPLQSLHVQPLHAPPPRCWGHLSTQSAPLCGPQVAELASRIVRVWKGQLAEHRDQTGGPKRPSHVAAAFRRRL